MSRDKWGIALSGRGIILGGWRSVGNYSGCVEVGGALFWVGGGGWG